MATSKKPAAKTAAAPAPAPVPVKEAAKEEKVPLAKMRGPRGVPEQAKITVLSDKNPKRDGSKAFSVFELYATGMTVGAFCDAVDKTDNKGAATPNLVYDAAHGFIKIEGYEPPGGVIPVKTKAEKKEKPAKEAKGTPVKADPNKKAKADAEAKEETAD